MLSRVVHCVCVRVDQIIHWPVTLELPDLYRLISIVIGRSCFSVTVMDDDGSRNPGWSIQSCSILSQTTPHICPLDMRYLDFHMLDFQKKSLIFHQKRKKYPKTDRTSLSDLLYQSCRLFGASGSHDTQVLEAPNLFAD